LNPLFHTHFNIECASGMFMQQEQNRDLVQNLLSVILCQEDVLQKLERVQAADILDVEGASVVFDRLTDLTGSRDEAALLIDKAVLEPFDINIQEFVETRQDACTSKALPFLQVLESLQNLEVQDSSEDGGDMSHLSRRLQVAYEKALHWAANLDKEACITLLCLWLFALMAKDASVIVNMKVLAHHGGNVDATTRDPSVEKYQDEQYAGVVVCQGRKIAYTIALVDTGPKDISKIWSKATEETEVVRRALLALQCSDSF